MKEPEKLSRGNGIKAIIALQGMAGISETEETAGVGWDKMPEGEQQQTLQAYKVCFADAET